MRTTIPNCSSQASLARSSFILVCHKTLSLVTLDISNPRYQVSRTQCTALATDDGRAHFEGYVSDMVSTVDLSTTYSQSHSRLLYERNGSSHSDTVLTSRSMQPSEPTQIPLSAMPHANLLAGLF